MLSYTKREIERARETKKYFARLYEVSETSVVWAGDDKFIICKEGKEIKVGFGVIDSEIIQ